MQFSRSLRPAVREGRITCSVRIWQRPQVKVGGRYAMAPGQIEVTSLREITRDDITDALAQRSGFADVADLLSVAQHGRGDTVYLVEFHYIPPVDDGVMALPATD